MGISIPSIQRMDASLILVYVNDKLYSTYQFLLIYFLKSQNNFQQGEFREGNNLLHITQRLKRGFFKMFSM